MRYRLATCLVAAPVVVLASACSKSDGASVVKVTASDDACGLDSTELAAGSTTFRITNSGKKVTEVYVYAERDRVVSERENIGPGTNADLNTDLAAGTYEVACKPGQTGDGIRTKISVTGEGGKALATTGDVEVHFAAADYHYTGLDGLDLVAGTTVDFEMVNKGTVEHEFEVFGPDGKVLGEIGPTKVGKEGKVVLTLAERGAYRYVCGIDDHEKLGMVGTFTVA